MGMKHLKDELFFFISAELFAENNLGTDADDVPHIS